MPYTQARNLLIAAGIVALLVVAGVMLARGVDRVEVWGAVLFIPVFLAFMLGGPVGGLVGGLIAAGLYFALRSPAIDAVGAGEFTGLIVSRAVAYLAFGVVGGIANRQLEASLDKLDLYDHIDDATGLNNSRSFLLETDLEMNRARRYETFFSVAVVDIPAPALAALGRRKRGAVLRELGRLLHDSVRSVDHPVHGFDGDRHRLAVVLPETGPEGAQVFGERLAARLADFLTGRGVALNGLAPILASYPDGEVALAGLREEFGAIDRVEHPIAPSAPSARAAASRERPGA